MRVKELTEFDPEAARVAEDSRGRSGRWSWWSPAVGKLPSLAVETLCLSVTTNACDVTIYVSCTVAAQN